MHGSGWDELFFTLICLLIGSSCVAGFIFGFTYGKGIAKGREDK
jgi:hypothetical protein